MATSSSGSSNSKDFEDFISEVQDIEKGKAQDDSGDDDTKTPDGTYPILSSIIQFQHCKKKSDYGQTTINKNAFH